MFTSYTYDPFWREVNAFFTHIPEGYELVEKPEHKKARLERELQEKKALLAQLNKRASEVALEIENEQKELLSLNSGEQAALK